MIPTLHTVQGRTNEPGTTHRDRPSSSGPREILVGLKSACQRLPSTVRSPAVCGDTAGRGPLPAGVHTWGVRGQEEKRQRSHWKAPSRRCPNPGFPHMGTQEFYTYASPRLVINWTGGTLWGEVNCPKLPQDLCSCCFPDSS